MRALPLDVEQLTSELEALQRRLESGDGDSPELLARSLESLRTTLEELRVAEEHLIEQNEALAEAQLALETERARYAELFQLAPDAYVVTDAHGTVLEANRGAGDLFAVRERFLVGKPLAAFLAPASRPGFRERLLELAAARGPAQLQLRFDRRGGVTFDASVTVAPIRREPGGAPSGMRWLVRDETEQKQAEERLWELNAELEERVRERTDELLAQSRLLETVLEQLPVGVVIAEAPSGRVIRSNLRAQELLGRPVDRLGADEPVLPAHAPDGRRLERDELPLARAVRNGEEVHNERIELSLEDGERRVLAVSAAPVRSEANEIVAAAVVLDDVSARERRERAEREFVANAAHELRSPLAAIVSAVEVLQAGAKDDPAELELFLGHVERESERLARLGRALLVLARAQGRAEQPRLEIVPLRPLLGEIAASLRPAAQVKVSVRCRKDLAVLTSRDLLEHALGNMAANAAHHTSAGTIVLAARARKDEAVIEVRDTGAGMSQEVQEHVFTRFFRGGARDTERFGLGLAIAKEVVETIGGAIELESAVDAGTTARIRLPLARMVEP